MLVGEILDKLGPRKKYDLDVLVGMDNQLENAMKLLDIGAGGVRYMIIHGMGGIGKTTLAKAIFNELSASFDNSCFLDDLRETSRRGPDYMQKKMGHDLDPKFATLSNLRRDIRDRFRGRKVLVVLDDVGVGEQIEMLARKSWFASGSRIIITTRNINVVNECQDLDVDSVRSLEMSLLQENEALRLFNMYMFNQETPPVIHKNISVEAASTCGGLPLALKVLASLLRGKSERLWGRLIAKSKEIPPLDVKNRLKISYDELDHDQQQIFLDTACFFIGSEISNPCYMWEACEFYPIYGLEVLVSMSLVKITYKNVIWMHDLLRDLGRDIVHEESKKVPMKRSRIWLQEDSMKVLMAKEGKEMVEALTLRRFSDIALTDENCSSFQNIRFLELAGAKLEVNSEDLLKKLIWLSWHLCAPDFKLSHFNMKRLVILDLSHSFIDENWGGWSMIQMADNLKVLDLRSCHNLTRTPDFKNNRTLERLNLSYCDNLATVDSSIENLSSLKLLDLQHCYSLTCLPEEIGSLENLKEILVSGHYGIFSLPESIGKLKSLVSLSLERLQINELPDTVGGLVKLEKLSISYCYGMLELPESVGKLEALAELQLPNWWGRKLPRSIGRLEKLKVLNLQGCGSLEELPDSFENLKSLYSLNLSGTAIDDLAAVTGVGDLREMAYLHLSGCKIRTLPSSIGRMKKLRILMANGCESLEEISTEIGELSWLTMLGLSVSSIRALPLTISRLPFLMRLSLTGCYQLQALPELPLSLLDLSVYNSTDSIVDSNLKVIQKLPMLETLKLGFPTAAIVPAALSSLTQLKTLRLVIEPLDPPTTSSERELPCLSNLKKLSLIGFNNFMMDDGVENLGVRDLENLEKLEIEDCSRKLIEVCLAKNLKFLSIERCPSSLPDLSHLTSLSHLHVIGREEEDEIYEIPGLGELESLNSLFIQYCNIKSLDLSSSKKLSELILEECHELTVIHGVDGLFLQDLSITRCEEIQNVHQLLMQCKRGSFNERSFENYGLED